MANPEHVRVVKQGAAAVAAWRETHPGERLDLEEIFPFSANLQSADLSGPYLVGASFRSVNVRFANLSKANLGDANLGTVKQQLTVQVLVQGP